MKRPGVAKKTLKYIFSVLLALVMLIPQAITPMAVSATPAVPYFRTITVEAGQVPSTQTDFPMLVSLSGDYLKTAPDGHVANADGSDIYFTDTTGTVQYPFEIEQYDGVTGTLVAWVKVPSLSDGTVINMYYGGSPVTNTPTDVWSNGFQGVWHMGQITPSDSTANGNNGVAQGTGTLTETSGKISGAVNFPGNSTPAYISAGSSSSLDFIAANAYTWSAWVNPPGSQSGGSGLLEKKTAGTDITGQGYAINLGGGSPTIRFQSTSDSTHQLASSGTAVLGQWTFITATYNNGTVSLYVNGSPDNSGPIPSTDDTINNFLIGRRSASETQGYFLGMIDEVEYSSGVRSADWILTQYRNQTAPDTFYTVSDETVIGHSTDATLSNLTISAGTLVPDFASGTYSYTTGVDNTVSSVTVTPTVNESHATVKVNDTAVNSGEASGDIPLSVGDNVISIVVTAQDGTTTQTYTVTVSRAAPGVSADASLSSLVISAGTLSPDFAAGTYSYTDIVENAVSSVTVTPTVNESNATVKVNDVTVNSGEASGDIPLSVGDNVISVVVTAQDGTTTLTYTITVNREEAGPSIVTQPLDQTVTAGSTAIFAAVASGTPTPKIQWQVSTDGGVTWKNLELETNNCLYLYNAGLGESRYGITTSENGNQYRAVYTNIHGTATTNAVTLRINAAVPADTTPPYWVTEGYANSVDTATSPYTVHLSWSGATDDVGVTQYRVYNSNMVIATVTTTSFDYVLPSVVTDNYYYFKVQAGDAAGNWDTYSNLMGHAHDGPVITQGYSVYDGIAGGPATAPQWNTADTTGWLRAYNVGTAAKPDTLFKFSQPVGGDYSGLTWGYIVLSDYVTAPQMHIDSVNSGDQYLSLGDQHGYADYASRGYLWTTDNVRLHIGGYGSFNAWPEVNKNYYFSMMARDHNDSLHVRSPEVHFSTGWQPMMYAYKVQTEPNGTRTLSYPPSTVSYVESSGSGAHQTIYNIITSPLDPENAWFQLNRTGGTNPGWSVAAGAVDPHFVLTDKETGAVIPLTPNLVSTPTSYGGWPYTAVGTPSMSLWDPSKGTFFGWKTSSSGGQFIECHMTYSGSPAILQSNHTYVLSINGPWTGLYIPANYTYSFEFTTAAADKAAPTWPDGAALTNTAVTPTTVSLSWLAADDNVGVTAYKVYRNGTLVATLGGEVITYTDTGLTPGSTYNWYVTAQDYLVNVSGQLALGPITTPVDTTTPTWPGGSTLTAQNIEAVSLDLVWTAAVDDFPVANYRVYKGDELIATVAGNVLTYHVTGLTPGGSYALTVQAGDESGNWSTDGPSVSIGTGEDTLAPTWPNGSTPTVTGVTATTISLTWPAAADNYKVDHYEMTVNGNIYNAAIPAATTSLTITDLVPASGYDILITAVDPAGNRTDDTLLNQWVPSQKPTYGSGIEFYLITPSKNISSTPTEMNNIITSLVSAGDLHLRFLFFKEMDPASLQMGITLTDETAAQAIDLSGATFTLTPTGTSETFDFATTSNALQAGHTYAIRLAASIAAADATMMGKDFVWRFTTPYRPDRIVAESDGTPGQWNYPDNHLILQSDGTVWQWSDGAVLWKVNGLDHVIAISAASQMNGDGHATGYDGLALRDDGTVWRWTSIEEDVNHDIVATVPVPTQVAGIDGVQAISAHFNNFMALRYDGTVWAWGGNYSGSCGVGQWPNAAGMQIGVGVPTQCPGLTQVTAIISCFKNTYALCEDETVWAVGNNAWGQLGTRDVIQHSPFENLIVTGGQCWLTAYFQQIPGFRRIVSIGAVDLHGTAVDRDGNVWHWGNIANPWPPDAILNPQLVSGMSNAKAVSGGASTDVVLRNDGTVQLTNLVTLNINDVVFVEGAGHLGGGHVITADGGLYSFDITTGITTLESALQPNISVDAPASVLYNSDFTASIDVNRISNFNVADYTITYDPAVLRLDDITAGDIGGSAVPVYFNENPAGTIKVVNDLNMPATGVSGSGSLAVLHFHVIGAPGQTSQINISNGTLASNEAAEILAVWTSSTVTVTPISTTVTLSNLVQIYDGTPKAVTVVIDPTGLAYTITYDGSSTVPVNAGSYAVVVTIIEPNYEGSATGTLVINKADQTITFAAIEDKGYASPDFEVTATASSGLPVTFTASGNCTVTGNVVHITGTISGTITASQAGDANYNAAPDVARTFNILVTAGDANGDGKINALDITKTIRIVLQLDPATDTADANGDGKINALDIAQIELIILNSN